MCISIYYVRVVQPLHTTDIVPQSGELLRPANNTRVITNNNFKYDVQYIKIVIVKNVYYEKTQPFQSQGAQYSQIGYATKINRFHTVPRSNGIYNVVHIILNIVLRYFNMVLLLAKVKKLKLYERNN